MSHDRVELKPCPTPWCEQKGGEPYVFERRRDCLGVYCPSCGVSTGYFPNEAAAIEQWNTRTLDPSIESLQAEVERLREVQCVTAQAQALLDKVDADSSVRWKFFNELRALRQALAAKEQTREHEENR